MSNPIFDKQVENFHQQIIELIKRYQFRDRDRIQCHGISVSQCYVLEALHSHDTLSVNELANKMYLSISTITRVVDQLVKKRYVTRQEDTTDRRVRVLRLTKAGEDIFRKSWDNVFESEKKILENFPPENREMLIDFLHQLNQAVESWQSSCQVEL